MINALLVVAFFSAMATSQIGLLADEVYGQGSFNTSVQNFPNPPGTTNAQGFRFPRGLAVSNGFLYVSDTVNRRVLRFPAGSIVPDLVWGQPDFTSSTQLATATNMVSPRGIAVSACCLFVTDGTAHRVTVYPNDGPPGVAAFRVYGQLGSFLSSSANIGGISENSLSGPNSIALDHQGNVWIVDKDNHRVLCFLGSSTTASTVIGQANFMNGLANRGTTVGPDTLNGPSDIAFDSFDNFYVADLGNSRILFFLQGATVATRVFGQPDFSSSTAAAIPTATGLNAPNAVGIGVAGEVLISDFNFNRITVYGDPTLPVATGVYGQGSLTSNVPGPTQTLLVAPVHVFSDVAGNVFVSEINGHRVVRWGSASTTIATTSLPPVVVGAVIVPKDTNLTITGPVTINGNLKVDGYLAVLPGASLSVNGSVVVFGTLGSTSTGTIAVNGLLTIGRGATLQPIVTLPAAGSITIVVATYRTFGGGLFASLDRSAVQGLAMCEQAAGDVTYGATSLSVTVSKIPCTSLSPGAITGIVLGCVTFGVGIGVAVLLFRRREIATHQIEATARIKEKHLSVMRRQPPN